MPGHLRIIKIVQITRKNMFSVYPLAEINWNDIWRRSGRGEFYKSNSNIL